MVFDRIRVEVKKMGQVILEIPQNVNRTFRIESEEKAASILEQLTNDDERLRKFEEGVASGAIKLPTHHNRREAGDAVLGIWADREESAQEIARKIREGNRKVT